MKKLQKNHQSRPNQKHRQKMRRGIRGKDAQRYERQAQANFRPDPMYVWRNAFGGLFK